MRDEPPPPDAPMEGWNISSRRVLGAMVAILLVLAGALSFSQHRYRATIEPTTHPRIRRFPAPGLDGFDDPARPTPVAPPAPTPLDDAALATAASAHAVLQDAPQ